MLFRRIAIVARSGIAQSRGFCRVTPMRLLGVSPFSAFVKKVYKDPKFKNMPIPQRGKLMGQMYRALPEAEKEKLRTAAAKMKTPKHRSGWKCSKPKKPTVYSKFVKAQMKTPAIKKLPNLKRMAAIAKVWKAAKK